MLRRGVLLSGTAGLMASTASAMVAPEYRRGATPMIADLVAAGSISNLISPLAYGSITDGGAFGDWQAHPAASNGYSTLTALQAVYPFATATTNDMAGLMIQAAIDAAHAANSGTVFLANGGYRNLPSGLIFPPGTNAKLMGEGYNTVLLCQNCGTNPGISLSKIQNTVGSVSNILLQGLNTRVDGMATGGGKADSSIYKAGSVGLFMSQCWNSVFTSLHICNFDDAYRLDKTGGVPTYVITFRDCMVFNNNKGVSIDFSNSGTGAEKMTWDGCSISNNNYGVYLILSGSATPGAAASLATDVYLINCSLDYNLVKQIYYIGGMVTGDLMNSLYVTGCHIETSSDCSGLMPRIFNDGNMAFTACEFYENKQPPIGIVTGTLYSHTSFINCKSPVLNYPGEAKGCPLFYSTEGIGPRVNGYGNTNRCGSEAILFRGPNGDVSDFRTCDPNYLNSGFRGDVTLNYQHQNAPMIMVCGNIGITVPPAGKSNFIIGTVMRFVTLPGYTGTFVEGSGVTIATGGKGLSFGGPSAKEVALIKIGNNTWMVTGGMT